MQVWRARNGPRFSRVPSWRLGRNSASLACRADLPGGSGFGCAGRRPDNVGGGTWRSMSTMRSGAGRACNGRTCWPTTSTNCTASRGPRHQPAVVSGTAADLGPPLRPHGLRAAPRHRARCNCLQPPRDRSGVAPGTLRGPRGAHDRAARNRRVGTGAAASTMRRRTPDVRWAQRRVSRRASRGAWCFAWLPCRKAHKPA